MIGKLNKMIKKSLLVVMTFIFVICGLMSNVNGQQYQINVGERINYPSWFDKGGNWSTKMYSVDGHVAYCLEASKHSPKNGTVVEGRIVDNENLQKVLYYGYGGPADTLSTDGVTSAKSAYLLTHIAASYYYAGDLHGVDMERLRGWGWAEWIESIPSRPAIPKGEVGFSKNNLTMYQDGQIQRTEEITVTGEPDATLSMTLDSGVTMHNTTTNKSSTGNVQLRSGEKFYLSAPLTSRSSYTWSSGKISGVTNNYYKPLVLTIDNTTQTVGTMVLSSGEAAPTSLQVNYLSVGSLKLIKVDENNQLLDGAVFNLKGVNNSYNQNHVVKDGSLQIDNLLVGDYILTEVKTPDGYDSTNKQYPITIKENKVTTQTVINELRPVGKLVINKKLEDQTKDLSGIEFKVMAKEDIKDIITKKIIYKAGEVIGKDVYVTDEEGKIVINNLPIGKYLVTEVKTKPGYVLDGIEHEVNFEKKDNITKEYEYVLDVENKLTQTSILKTDALTKKPLSGATLQLYLKENDSLTLVDQWVSTNEEHLIKGLLVGRDYVLKEIDAPNGYNIAPDFTFTIENSDELRKIEFENKAIPVVLTGDTFNSANYVVLALGSAVLLLKIKKVKLVKE